MDRADKGRGADPPPCFLQNRDYSEGVAIGKGPGVIFANRRRVRRAAGSQGCRWKACALPGSARALGSARRGGSAPGWLRSHRILQKRAENAAECGNGGNCENWEDVHTFFRCCQIQPWAETVPQAKEPRSLRTGAHPHPKAPETAPPPLRVEARSVSCPSTTVPVRSAGRKLTSRLPWGEGRWD
eukprot:gene16990-biopygen8293